MLEEEPWEIFVTPLSGNLLTKHLWAHPVVLLPIIDDLEVKVYGNSALGKTSTKYIVNIEDFMGKIPEVAKASNGGIGTPVKFIGVSLDKLDSFRYGARKEMFPVRSPEEKSCLERKSLQKKLHVNKNQPAKLDIIRKRKDLESTIVHCMNLNSKYFHKNAVTDEVGNSTSVENVTIYVVQLDEESISNSKIFSENFTNTIPRQCDLKAYSQPIMRTI
ncbi:unnamed protein product [Allacma fusca]|uniref:Uncharacterized protein n=1 Tax=Allacma fusca TaxID=39272 RepID=A0A8J2L731_9HEXA|nr:unnamed protein product [Allacma fusca]